MSDESSEAATEVDAPLRGKRIIEVGTGKKRIEFRNTRKRADTAGAAAATGEEV